MLITQPDLNERNQSSSRNPNTSRNQSLINELLDLDNSNPQNFIPILPIGINDGDGGGDDDDDSDDVDGDGDDGEGDLV